jgi:type VI secretion system protein VasG
MSREFLGRLLEGKPLAGVQVSVQNQDLHYEFAATQ